MMAVEESIDERYSGSISYHYLTSIFILSTLSNRTLCNLSLASIDAEWINECKVWAKLTIGVNTGHLGHKILIVTFMRIVLSDV